MRRSFACSGTLSIALALLLLVPALAGARPAGRLPDAHALRRAGLAVRWPLTQPNATVPEGAQLTVTVRRLRRDAPVAHVDFVRVAASGLAQHIVVSRRLHAGHVTVTVPKRGHYVLRLRAGRLTYVSWVDLLTLPPPPVPNPCPAAGTPAATLTLDAAQIAAGGSVGYAFADTGTTCLTIGTAYSWQRWDGAWTTVPSTMAFTTVALILHPGNAYRAHATLEPAMGAGHYRLVVGYTPQLLAPPTPAPEPSATAELDVVP